MKQSLRALSDPKLLLVFLMGFASGLPLLLTGSTLQAWFFDMKTDLHTISMFGLVAIPYSIKFFWAPFLDRWVPPFWGRRRGWMAISQVGLMCALAALAYSEPGVNNTLVILIAIAITTLSATQDIAIDAYRREILPTSLLGLGSSLAITGYRLAMMVSVAGSLVLADKMSFRFAYLVMAALMGFTLITTFLAPEPELTSPPPKSVREAYAKPFAEFFSRDGAIWILIFIVIYKFGDNMATALTTPFYQGLGYSKTEIGEIAKVVGLSATIAGGLIGGTIMIWLGMRRSLMVFGIFQGAANISFAWLATTIPTLAPAWRLTALGGAVGIENLSAGMGTAAYTAFMMYLTDKRYTATQYALFTSLMSISRVMLGSPTGYLIERMGWPSFFCFCALCSIPGLLLLLKIGKYAPGADLDSATT